VFVLANATLTNCIFTDNTCNDCEGAPAGGAIYGEGAITLEGCKFVVPANTSGGNNDLLGAATFACPPGTTGTPVTVAGGPHTIKQLPPSTEIVHCV
jgi:predicted outer membrane repeat protein